MTLKHVIIDRFTGDIIKTEDMPDDVDPEVYLRQQMHDCPECRAAFARGETPTFGSVIPLGSLGRDRPQRARFPRPPRWRTRKRG